MFYIRSKVFRWANFRRAKIQTVFLKEGVKTRSWKLEAAIKRVDSIDSNCRNAYTREGRENYEQRSGCYTTRATKATWKVYVHMYARSSNCQLNDAKHMDYFVATTLFRDAPRFVFDDSKRSRASELSKSRPDLLGTGKIIIHPELWQKFLAGWEKCQCLFDPYNLSYRSLELDRFSYISLFARKRILPKGDIDLSCPLEEIRDVEKKISFNTLVLCLLLKASSRGLLVDKFSRVIDPEVA